MDELSDFFDFEGEDSGHKGILSLADIKSGSVRVGRPGSDFWRFCAASLTSFKDIAAPRFRVRRGGLTGFSGVLESHGFVSRWGNVGGLDGELDDLELDFSIFFDLNDSNPDLLDSIEEILNGKQKDINQNWRLGIERHVKNKTKERSEAELFFYTRVFGAKDEVDMAPNCTHALDSREEVTASALVESTIMKRANVNVTPVRRSLLLSFMYLNFLQIQREYNYE